MLDTKNQPNLKFANTDQNTRCHAHHTFYLFTNCIVHCNLNMLHCTYIVYVVYRTAFSHLCQLAWSVLFFYFTVVVYIITTHKLINTCFGHLPSTLNTEQLTKFIYTYRICQFLTIEFLKSREQNYATTVGKVKAMFIRLLVFFVFFLFM